VDMLRSFSTGRNGQRCAHIEIQSQILLLDTDVVAPSAGANAEQLNATSKTILGPRNGPAGMRYHFYISLHFYY
jgi:hypothetical protein